jgi:hypothetical protein
MTSPSKANQGRDADILIDAMKERRESIFVGEMA